MADGKTLYIDGGGSSLKVFIRDESTQTHSRLASIKGNFNILSGHAEAISKTLSDLLQKFPAEHIIIGLAGLESRKQKAALKAEIIKNMSPATPGLLTVGSDLELCFRLYFTDGDGMMVILGTGSVFAAKCDGEIIKVGGYGKIIGDPGSGYQISQKALSLLLQHYDGLIEDPEFYNAFSPIFTSRENLIEKVYQKRFPIQTLSKVVFELAEKNNKNARSILINQAKLVQAYVDTLKQKVKLSKALPIQLHGGLVEQESFYLQELKKRLY
jgi:N-acetylglucosamine kinase-like BadF-type ATPase